MNRSMRAYEGVRYHYYYTICLQGGDDTLVALMVRMALMVRIALMALMVRIGHYYYTI